MGDHSPIAVNTLAWHGYDLEIAFHEIAALGVEYVEPALIASYYPQMDDSYFSQTTARRMRDRLDGHALRVIAVGAHMSLGTLGAVTAFQRRLEFAACLGAQIVHTNSARRSEETTFLQNMEKLSKLAEGLNLTIALENPGDGTDNLISTGIEAAALIRRIGSARVRLNYDFSNLFSYHAGKIRPEEDFHFALPYCVHLHFKEMRQYGQEWRFVEIGGGALDYGSILRTLAASNMFPPFSLEMPLRFVRSADGRIRLKPETPPVPLESIRGTVSRSLDFINSHLMKGNQP